VHLTDKYEQVKFPANFSYHIRAIYRSDFAFFGGMGINRWHIKKLRNL